MFWRARPGVISSSQKIFLPTLNLERKSAD